MEKRDLKHNTLYFHMGPGFHSKIEAEVFSCQYPHVLFLDQPLSISFSELIQWAEQEIKKAFILNDEKPVSVLGHSFGAQIISAALKSNVEYIKEARFLNSPSDSFSCFYNLHNHLFKNTEGYDFWKNQSLEDKLNLIFKVAAHPRCAESYWQNMVAKQQYDSIAVKYPQLDVTTFVKVFTGYLEGSHEPKEKIWDGPIRIYFSLDDKLIKDSIQVEHWKKIYPSAQLIAVNGVGHYGLFESESLANDFFGI